MVLVNAVLTLAAKIAGASTVAQVTAGLGLTIASVTGAGTAGVLPAPVQDAFARTVEAVTPFQAPHANDARKDVATPPATPSHEPVEPAHPTNDVVPVAVNAPTTEGPEAQEGAAASEHSAEAKAADDTPRHHDGRASGTTAARSDATETEHDGEPAENEPSGTEDSHSGASTSRSDDNPSGPAGSNSSGSGSSASGGHHGGDD